MKKHNVFTKELTKAALSPNHEKIIESIDSKKHVHIKQIKKQYPKQKKVIVSI